MNRAKLFLFVFVGVLAGKGVDKLLDWFVKPIVARNIEHVIEQDGNHIVLFNFMKFIARSFDLIPHGFWYGVFLILGLWGFVELYYWLSRPHYKDNASKDVTKKDTDQTLELTVHDFERLYPHTGIKKRLSGKQKIREITDANYVNKIINLPEAMSRPDFCVEKVVFRECIFAGPCVVSFAKCFLRGHVWLNEQSIEENFIEISEWRSKFLLNCVVKFNECTFIDCVFYRITLVTTANHIAEMKESYLK